MDADLRDAWRTLGLAPGTAMSEARRAWRRLAQAHHPDHGGRAGEFQRVQVAWERVRLASGETWADPGPKRDHGPADTGGAGNGRETREPDPEPAPVDDDLDLGSVFEVVDLVLDGVHVGAGHGTTARLVQFNDRVHVQVDLRSPWPGGADRCRILLRWKDDMAIYDRRVVSRAMVKEGLVWFAFSPAADAD
jgi:hypothetical protein